MQFLIKDSTVNSVRNAIDDVLEHIDAPEKIKSKISVGENIEKMQVGFRNGFVKFEHHQDQQGYSLSLDDQKIESSMKLISKHAAKIAMFINLYITFLVAMQTAMEFFMKGLASIGVGMKPEFMAIKDEITAIARQPARWEISQHHVKPGADEHVEVDMTHLKGEERVGDILPKAATEAAGQTDQRTQTADS